MFVDDKSSKMFQKILFVFTCYIAIFSRLTEAMTAEQKVMIQNHVEEMAIGCMTDNPLTEDDIMKLKSRQIAAGDSVPCFLSCLFSHIGLINDKGMLEKENALELARKVFQDEEEIKVLSDFLHTCSAVNSEPVSDGVKGCERAMKTYKCFIEKGAEFGFDL